ncbi:uncharacterized protein LOC135384433 [Ornithodoros turicata]|uniref:uncharacterized protein LOC135384433 n=1 Tax=Ornithodoros turicata TaxID=34597 RepID=UPI003139416D
MAPGRLKAANTRDESLVFLSLRGEVFEAVDELVEEYNQLDPSKAVDITAPAFSVLRLQEMRDLLRPIREATDALQGDGVTSSIVRLCISTCYIQIQTFNTTTFPVLRLELPEEIDRRFKATLSDDYLIGACVLNARIQLRVFEQTVALGLSKATSADARKVLHGLLDAQQKAVGHQEDTISDPVPSTSRSEHAVDLSRALGIYGVLDTVFPVPEVRQTSELGEYLAEDYDVRDVCTFWKHNSSRYPKLGLLAEVCFGIPATSGGVERLFSVAGAIQRARRSSLLPTTVEKLIHVVESVKRSKGQEAGDIPRRSH